MPERLTAAIQDATRHLLALQHEDGHWCGELGADTTLESDYIMFMHYLDDVDEQKQERLAQYILSQQCEDGGWHIYPGGPSEINATVKAYFALRCYGLPKDDGVVVRARKAALRLGGIPRCNTFSKIYLALFGLLDWEDVPAIPPELLFLPDYFYINIYEMSSWSRAILVPLSIIYAHHPVKTPPGGFALEELFPDGIWEPSPSEQPKGWWDRFFMGVDATLKTMEKSPVKPFRKQALKMAENWMLAHFQDSDGLGAIYPGMMNSMIALKCLGYSLDHPVFKREYRKFRDLEYPAGDMLKMQPCFSPLWDTAISCIALAQTGLTPDSPALQKAARWILDHEVKREGDWVYGAPGLEPGGWAFEYKNDLYPDIDDTAMVNLALHRIRMEEEMEKRTAMHRGANWVIGMQCDNGGWGAFDKNNQKALLEKVPFADHNAMLDPPSADVTARVLEMFGLLDYPLGAPPVQRGLRFLRSEQEADGSWYGRWGVNYIYGTWQALRGLGQLGMDSDNPMVRRGVEWLRSVQNDDGGWGESCRSYHDPDTKGQGPSTASQTAWACMGFIAAGEIGEPALHRGIRYLLDTQNEHGSWEEHEFTGTGFPKVFYLEYTMYRICFPLMALAEYRTAVAKQPPPRG